MAKAIQSFHDAINLGKICLHPTDSLPGLGFDPTNFLAKTHLERIKSNKEGNGFVTLVSSAAKAFEFWLPLPGTWQKTLERIWPAPLSVIWQANRRCPRALLGPNQTLCQRVPNLEDQSAWFAQFLESAPWPFPSTSVNLRGEPAATQWSEAVAFMKSHSHTFVPSWHNQTPTDAGPSTLIVLNQDGGFRILREGIFSIAAIEEALS